MNDSSLSAHVNHPGLFRRLLLAGVKLLETPLTAGAIAFFIFSAVSIRYDRFFFTSLFPYYNYVADALLHGEVWFRFPPLQPHDLILYSGKYSMYQGPFPALVIMPFVAIFGIGLSDVIYTLIFASVNVGLVAYLLRLANRLDLVNLSETQRGLLSLFFMLGTVHFTQAPVGRMWNTALVIGFTCVILAYIVALTMKGAKAWFFTGLALSAAMLTRNHLIFTGIFPLIYLFVHQRPASLLKKILHISFSALPILIGAGSILFYNQARFGSPWENGLPYHQMNPIMFDDFFTHGIFNTHYISKNLYYQYVFYPFPLREESYFGGSLFLLSPVFLGVFFAFRKTNRTWHQWVLLLTILVTTIPILLLMGTGFAQFGPRYTLDFTVPLLLLTARGVQNWKTPVLLILIFISIIQYLLGMPLWVL